MTEEQIVSDAYDIVVDGAESHAEDWIDEDGNYPGNEDGVFETQLGIVSTLRDPTVKAFVLEALVT